MVVEEGRMHSKGYVYMYVLVKAGGKRDRERDREAGETKFRQWVQPKFDSPVP